MAQTTAYVRITKHSWTQGKIEGEVTAAAYQWHFQWHFSKGNLLVKPNLGKALIQEPLARFLEHWDYHLEPGGDYQFTVRGKF